MVLAPSAGRPQSSVFERSAGGRRARSLAQRLFPVHPRVTAARLGGNLAVGLSPKP